MFNNAFFMNIAYENALLALHSDEVPVGAVIVKDTKIIARAHNLVEKNKNALHHAEILCIQEACKTLGEKYLIGCDLYVTLEPCIMCAGAIAHVKFRRVYFGAYDPKRGSVEHALQVFKYTNHKPEVYGGICEKKCKILLCDYFKTKRVLSC
ncbi:MAG: tRNA-specific adenosine deaminase [Alphaproteobacteria bacterium CG_4_10_14_0_8_um_filter_37_21]|nr:MAG: tRNA-specific adenosine deaminase [Alphaproteobacteria bacterium CG_4_10_14_0_8_um_filter_37_21]